METLSLSVVQRLIAKEQHQDQGFESFPHCAAPRFAMPIYDSLRFHTPNGGARPALGRSGIT